jgi:hypothetical protein
MKRLVVRIHHSTHPPFKLKLRPGTKVSDVLAYLHLCENYVLSPIADPRKQYTSIEVLYDLIKNDEKLIATLSPATERRYATFFMQ